MLILTRKVGERVRVRVPVGGGFADVWVVAIAAEAGRVKLGLEAPPEVEIARQEIIRHPNSGGHGGGETQG
jgi:carbon storage regulator CsrA